MTNLLEEKMHNVLTNVSGKYGVGVKHLSTGETAEINERCLFQTASSCKLAILATLFDEVEKGEISLQRRVKLTKEDLVPSDGILQKFDEGVEVTIKDLSTLMIIISDNMATDKILEIVNKKNVNQFTKKLGLDSMHLEHSIWELLSFCAGIQPKPKNAKNYAELDKVLEGNQDFSKSPIFDMNKRNNVSTPRDMNILLEKLALGTLVSNKASREMIKILKEQQFRDRIPGHLPDGVEVACKTGAIGNAVSDVGIVYLPNEEGCFVISILSKENETYFEAQETIARLSRTAYDHFVISGENR